ncbi:alpha-1,2-mannosyltransferase, putative [Leishmania guyanensis]|uniref:GDP-Man:Man(3)GlcNAc(2)-PP-Dol alpha-1,2-mannosyltransferase n=3 Tax=Viannia TaxID=37616 RepID=A0AAW3CAW4_9TRYP|nr:glycosyl transferase, putative [Leishmania guyanensis]
MLSIIALMLATLALLCRHRKRAYARNTVGFLHAAAGAGGGGERVLWVALDGLQHADAVKGVERQYVVYTNEYKPADRSSTESSDQHLLSLIESQFSIRLLRPVRFIYMRPALTRWLSGDAYPRLTLLLQTFCGGAALFYEVAVANAVTPIVVETVGVPFVYPLLRLLAGCTVISYTHYPIISSAMTQRVRSGEVSHTNSVTMAQYRLLRCAKVVYYEMFTLLYRCMGFFPNMVLTNSSWTQRHVQSLFWPRTCIRLYAPCDVARFAAGSRPPALRNNRIVSIGQFRPEKNHVLQLEAFHAAVPRLPRDAKLVMIGGVRNADDRKRVAQLNARAKELGVEKQVEIHVNAAVTEVWTELGSCVIGLHTMRDEHFGIVLLEYLAAGCIPLGHRSGGVELDIINSPDLGFLAVTAEEYTAAMIEICEMRLHDPERYVQFQRRGSEHVKSFDDSNFRTRFVELVSKYVYAC